MLGHEIFQQQYAGHHHLLHNGLPLLLLFMRLKMLRREETKAEARGAEKERRRITV